MRVMGDINRKKGKAARKVTRSRYVERSLPPLLAHGSRAYDRGAGRDVWTNRRSGGSEEGHATRRNIVCGPRNGNRFSRARIARLCVRTPLHL